MVIAARANLTECEKNDQLDGKKFGEGAEIMKQGFRPMVKHYETI